MKSKRIQHLKTGFGSAVAALMLLSNGVHAAPGNLADVPLFLGSSVQPNIFFAIDDSGSMNWETTLNDGTWNPGGVADTIIVHPPTDREYRRATCLGYNVLAYDPSTEYTPWKGEDEDGNTYTDATLTTAYRNPYDNESTINISNHVYFIWTDADMDGDYDGPGSTGFLAPIGPGEECGDLTSNTTPDAVSVNTLPATLNPGDAGYPNSQRNYANWYTYYRKREYEAKRAMSELIYDSNHRMGLATLNANNGIGIAVEDMTDDTEKTQLLDELGRVDSSGFTPLRRMLRNVGRYFDTAGNDSDHSALGFTNSSPILSQANGGECQQNFTVLFSDGFWNGGSPGFGNDDGDDDTTWDGGSHADTFSDTLADVAMYYYETDLATGLQNKVEPIEDVDENEAQHMVTYTVAFGIDGTLTANPPDRTTAFAWPQPVSNTNTTTDDMRHAAWNARGEFLSAKQPATLISSLEAALASIDSRIGTASAVTFNSNELDTGTQIFLTQFNSENWSGDLLAFDVNPSTGAVITPEAWSVTTLLDDAGFSVSGRTVYSYNNRRVESPAAAADPILFQWSSLSDVQKDDLKTNPDGSMETTIGFPVANARLDYLRGDRTEEESASGSTYNFRDRSSRLGDIVHSGPTFVGAPNAPYPDKDPFGASGGKRYSDFMAANATRKGIVYVGSGDGMVHGFDTTASGAEVLAYIPNALFDDSGTVDSGLHYLSDPNYTHKYYADLGISVGDVFISNNWATVLAGGLRAGGKGVFALDVTSASFPNTDIGANNTVLWEFDDTDSPFMGFTYSKPRIVLLNNNKWAVIFGNGYNSTNGEAALMILYVDGGDDGTWSASDYKIIETDVGTAGDVNGLGQVTVIDLNDDFIADRVYAGDIKGNLWAFDISDTNANNWDVAYQASGTPKPLFTAETGQPITVKGAITRTQTTTLANQPNVLVVLGTGQYLTTADPGNTDLQAIYGVWDAGTSELDKTDLVEQDLITGSSSELVRVMEDNAVNYAATPSSGDYGWYYEFNDPNESGDTFDGTSRGERMVIDPVIRGEQVFFATLIPDGGVCSDGGGDGWIMALDAFNGGEPTAGAFDVNLDGIVDASDQVDSKYVAGIKFTNGLPAGLGFLGGTNKLYITGTGGTGAGSISTQGIKELPDADIGRLSWQELIE